MHLPLPGMLEQANLDHPKNVNQRTPCGMEIQGQILTLIKVLSPVISKGSVLVTHRYFSHRDIYGDFRAIFGQRDLASYETLVPYDLRKHLGCRLLYGLQKSLCSQNQRNISQVKGKYHYSSFIFPYLFFVLSGFPGGSDCKESACNAGDPGLICGSGRSPREGNGNLLQY